MQQRTSNPQTQRQKAVVYRQLLLGCLIAQAGVQGAWAQQGGATYREEIVVKGEQLDQLDSAYSIASFDTQTIRELKISEPEGIFAQVPGVSIQDYGLSGVANAFTIRGFGGGGHGGDLGVVLDGIPLNEAMSHADGYVDLNVIVPLEIETFRVFKGPVSALYGNYNRGGLLKVNTRKGGDYTDLDISAGSDALADVQGAGGKTFVTGNGTEQTVNVAAQYFRTDGFRPQSDTERSTLAGRWGIGLGENTDLVLSGRWHSADSNNAAYITEAQYVTDPYGIDPEAQNDGAQKDFATARAELNHNLTDNLRLLTFAYATRQDFTRWFSRPTGDGWRQREETYDREVEGLGASLNGQNDWSGTNVTWVAGVESFFESTHYEYYDGLDHRQRTAPAINNREVELDSNSVFAEVQAEWHRLFRPSIGLRYDSFSGDCTPVGEETDGSPCESLNDLDNLSPKLGFLSNLSDAIQLRVSWAEGFALPGGWVKYQSQAANLDPVVFQQQEVGVSFTPSDQFKLDLAAYVLESDGEVRTVAPGEYENYGATERSGIEASVTWWPVETLTLSAVYGTADSEILENDDPSLIGNEVGGVSDYSATVNAAWQFLPAWQVDLEWRAVGGFSLDAANTQYSDDYDFLNAGLTYTHPGTDSWKAYVEVDNITDEVYAPAEFIIGGGPVYGPGAPRQIRVGVQISL